MLAFPGCYDSTRRMVASGHYYDSRTEVTRKELQAAKLADWKAIAVSEAVMASFLGAIFFVYLRLEKDWEK